jgi:hypothetical protein
VKDHSAEGFIGGIILTLVIILPWASFSSISGEAAAIIDNGCASSSAISDSPDDIKQRIDTYKVENL